MNTNAETQQVVADAISIVGVTLSNTTDEFHVAKLTLLHSALTVFRFLSASANDIPGYRGLGHTEAMAISKQIIEAGTVSAHTLNIFRFNNIFTDIQLER